MDCLPSTSSLYRRVSDPGPRRRKDADFVRGLIPPLHAQEKAPQNPLPPDKRRGSCDTDATIFAGEGQQTWPPRGPSPAPSATLWPVAPSTCPHNTETAADHAFCWLCLLDRAPSLSSELDVFLSPTSDAFTLPHEGEAEPDQLESPTSSLASSVKSPVFESWPRVLRMDSSPAALALSCSKRLPEPPPKQSPKSVAFSDSVALYSTYSNDEYVRGWTPAEQRELKQTMLRRMAQEAGDESSDDEDEDDPRDAKAHIFMPRALASF